MDSAEHQLPSDRFVGHSLRRDPSVRFVRGDNARLWNAAGREEVARFIEERVHGRVAAPA